MATLAEKLSDLANVAPIFQDPEDDVTDLTLAKLAHRGNEKEDNHGPGSKRSALRTKSASLLSEEDKKYVGKKVSRHELNDDVERAGMVNSKALLALKKKLNDSNDDDDDDDDDGSDQMSENDEDTFSSMKKMGMNGRKNEDDEEIYQVDDDDGALKSAEELYRANLMKAMKEFNKLSDDENEDDLDESNEDLSKDFLLEEDEDEKTQSKKSTKQFSFVDDGDYSKYADDEEEDDDDEEEDDDDDEEEDDDDFDDEKEDDEEDVEYEQESHSKKKSSEMVKDDIKQFSSTALNDDIEKGKAAKNQLAIWDGLLESRIKLQKTVSNINQLPQPSIWSLFSKLGGEDFNNLATDAQYELRTLLDKLVQLQTILLLQNPVTKKILTNEDINGAKKPQTNGKPIDNMAIEDDEEITSEEEDGGNSKKPSPESSQTNLLKRKIPLDEYPEFLAKRHTDFIPFRNDTINKWNSKTQLVSGKVKSKGFSAFNQSALKQIDQILSDKERLIKRTQLKRGDYRVLGTTQEEKKQDPLPSDEAQNEKPVHSAINDYDSEIFDDSDFYHHMLREFIDRKSSEIDDPLALGRQWLEVQKSRTKVKRNVDTKASKGRKLRYNVHPKLVNFMAPVNNSEWTDEARDDLYKSLFGQRVILPEDNS